MARYSEEAKEQVRDAVDFVDLVGSRTPLRPAGLGRLEGLCVFHEERTPSLSVDPVHKLYHCFGCEAGGDVFEFVQETEGLDFRGAIEFLADRYGVPLEHSAEDPAAAAARRRSEREHELLDRTADFYERYLWQSAAAAPAREYLASRGLQEQTLCAFRVGFAPDGFDVVLKASKAAGYSARECEAVGLAQPARNGRRIDRFRGRIMFPLTDRRGRMVGFGARALGAEQQPKYLNTSETRLFSKGRNLYGAHLARAAARQAGSVVLCEGYTDVIALHQAGAQNTVGSLGTAVTEHQVAELSRLAPTVQLALDADQAGREAVLRAGELAAARGLHARVIAVPAGRDPADVALGPDGPEAVAALIGASVPLVSFRVEHELAREPLTTAEAKDRAIDALRPVFAELPPNALREELLQTVATATQIPVAKVTDWLHTPDAAPTSPQDPGAAAAASALDRRSSRRARSPAPTRPVHHARRRRRHPPPSPVPPPRPTARYRVRRAASASGSGRAAMATPWPRRWSACDPSMSPAGRTGRSVRRGAWPKDETATSTTSSSASTHCGPSQNRHEMNKYGRLAKSHWATTDPSRYASISDPTRFFEELGQQAETEIQELALRLAGPDPAREDYLSKVGRLNMARLQAEEQVLAELILIEAPEDPEEPDSAPDLISDVQSAIQAAGRESDPTD